MALCRDAWRYAGMHGVMQGRFDVTTHAKWSVAQVLIDTIPFADQGSILFTWIDFNLSMDNSLHPLWSVRWNYVSIPKLQLLNRWSLGVDKYFHPTLGYTMLIKGTPGTRK